MENEEKQLQLKLTVSEKNLANPLAQHPTTAWQQKPGIRGPDCPHGANYFLGLHVSFLLFILRISLPLPYQFTLISSFFFLFNKSTISSIFNILISISYFYIIYFHLEFHFLKLFFAGTFQFFKKRISALIYMHNGLCRRSNFSRQFSDMHSLLNMYQGLFLHREAAIIL